MHIHHVMHYFRVTFLLAVRLDDSNTCHKLMTVTSMSSNALQDASRVTALRCLRNCDY